MLKYMYYCNGDCKKIANIITVMYILLDICYNQENSCNKNNSYSALNDNIM